MLGGTCRAPPSPLDHLELPDRVATTARIATTAPGRTPMTSVIKKILLTLVTAFLLYYIFTQPEQSAEAVKTFFGGIARLFRALAG